MAGGKPDSASWTERSVVGNSYDSFYTHYQGSLGHYFRTLYNLVKLVESSNAADKNFYTNLIRAQLSDHETLLLFYNCAEGPGKEKFKPLVEKYGLLKNVPRKSLIRQAHLAFYESSAFGQNSFSAAEIVEVAAAKLDQNRNAPATQ